MLNVRPGASQRGAQLMETLGAEPAHGGIRALLVSCTGSLCDARPGETSPYVKTRGSHTN